MNPTKSGSRHLQTNQELGGKGCGSGFKFTDWGDSGRCSINWGPDDGISGTDTGMNRMG